MEYLRDDSQPKMPGIHMSPVETVSACVNRLIGVEIIDQKPNYCLIKDMSDVTDKEFKNALRRVFILLQTEAESIKEGFSGNAESLKSIHIVDTNLDRFEDFCFRVLNKKGFPTMRQTSTMHSLIFTLEMIGDEFKKLAMHMLRDDGKHSPMIKELFKLMSDQFERFYKLFYKFDKHKAVELYKMDKDATKLATKYYKKMSDNEKELLHHLKKIGIYVLSLAELRIDMEF
jgi:phosphate uptake regulator